MGWKWREQSAVAMRSEREECGGREWWGGAAVSTPSALSRVVPCSVQRCCVASCDRPNLPDGRPPSSLTRPGRPPRW